MARCAQCGATDQSGHYCAQCGASLGGGLFTLLPSDPADAARSGAGASGADRSAMARTVAKGPARPRRRLAAVALAAAVVGSLAIADRVSHDSPGPQPSGTTRPTGSTFVADPAGPAAAAGSSLPSPDPNPADPGGPTGSADAGWPSTIAVPPGMEGTLLLGFADGSVATMALAGGTLHRIALLPLPLPTMLAPLGGAVLVFGDGGLQRSLRLVTPADATVAELPFQGWVQAAGPSGALLNTDSDLGPETTFLAADGSVSRVALPPRHRAVAVAGGQVLVEVQGKIARFDRAGGALAPVAEGEVIAADDVGLVRVLCPIGGCELRAGPWEDIDRLRLPVAVGHEPLQGQLTPDGARLLLVEDQPSGAPQLFVVDVADGRRRSLGGSWAFTTSALPAAPLPVSADGRYLIEAGGLFLTLHPLDGGGPLRVGPLPEAVIAAAMA